MSDRAKTALIMGAHGFAGRHLAACLEGRGWRVEGRDQFDCDIRDPGAVAEAVTTVRPDAVFHLAAIAFPGDANANPALSWAVNAEGANHVFEACWAARPRPRVVFVSSAYVVFGAPNIADSPMSEDLPPAPLDAYAAGKAAAEIAARLWAARGLDAVIARPFNHIGPGQNESFVAPAFALQIARIEQQGGKGEIAVGNLDAERDLTDVRDVARAYALLAEGGQAGRVYHICSGRALSIRRLLEALLAESTAEIKVRVDPARVRKADMQCLVGDPGRLNRELGWKPEIPFDKTVSDILEDARRRVGK